mgnify:CR=1 FL=1
MTRFAPILILALCGSACAQTVDVTGVADVSALVARQDELLARVKELEHFKHTPSRVNVLDYGCQPDDPKFDNGPLINAILANCGLKQGNHREEIYFPGGLYYHSTPIVFPTRTGLSVVGNGIGVGFPQLSYFGNSQLGGPRTTWIYTGSPKEAAVTIPCNGLYLRGINLQRGEWPFPRTDAPADGSVGLKFTCYSGMPSEMCNIPFMAIGGFDTAIAAERRSPDSTVNNNSDNVHFGFLLLQNNNVAFRLANYQSVDWTIEHLHVAFQTKVVFDCVEAAHVRCNYAVINSNNVTLARVGEPGNPLRPTSNNAFLDFPHVKIDPTAKEWRILEQREKCTFAIRATVFAGNKHVIDEKLIKTIDNTGYGRTVRVEVLQHGMFNDWQDGKWVPAGGAK